METLSPCSLVKKAENEFTKYFHLVRLTSIAGMAIEVNAFCTGGGASSGGGGGGGGDLLAEAVPGDGIGGGGGGGGCNES